MAILPLVSIVVPAYNHAGYLTEAIDSVLAQDYPNVELIVLNDGSTDNTAEVLQRYGDAFRWETHSNMGQASTLNKGWAMAKGEVLSYLSADDVLQPDAVSSIVPLLCGDVVMAYCDFNLIDPASRAIRRVEAPNFNYAAMLREFVCQPGPGAFMTRAAYEQVGGWNNTLRQLPDLEYWLRLGLVGRFIRVPKVLAGFRVHEESQTFSATSVDKAEEPLRVVQSIFEDPRFPQKLLGFKGQALSNAWLLTAQLHLRAGRVALGLHALKQSIFSFPKNMLSVRFFRVIANGIANKFFHRFLRRLRGGVS